MAAEHTLESVQQYVVGLLAKASGLAIGSFSLEDPLEKLKVDSLDLIFMVIEIEEHFKIEMPDERIENFWYGKDISEAIWSILKEETK